MLAQLFPPQSSHKYFEVPYALPPKFSGLRDGDLWLI